jgi:hypothetical protein
MFLFAISLNTIFKVEVYAQDTSSIAGFWQGENGVVWGIQDDGTLVSSLPNNQQIRGIYTLYNSVLRICFPNSKPNSVFRIHYVDKEILIIEDVISMSSLLFNKLGSENFTPIQINQAEILGKWQFAYNGYNQTWEFRQDKSLIDSAGKDQNIPVGTYEIVNNKLEIKLTNQSDVITYQVVYTDDHLIALANPSSRLVLSRVPEKSSVLDQTKIVGLWENLTYGGYLNEFGTDGVATLSSFSNIGVLAPYQVVDRSIKFPGTTFFTTPLSIEQLDNDVLVITDPSMSGSPITLLKMTDPTTTDGESLFGLWRVGVPDQFYTEIRFNEDGSVIYERDGTVGTYQHIGNTLSIASSGTTQFYEIKRLDNHFLVLHQIQQDKTFGEADIVFSRPNPLAPSC